jgi:hypothetical protein
VYTAVALLAVAFLSPVSFSFVPAILFVWYLVDWRRHYPAILDISTQLFVFFAIGVLYSPAFGTWLGLAISLPVLPILDMTLEDNSKKITFTETKSGRRLTNIYVFSLIIVVSTFVVAAFAGSLVLAISDTAIALYLALIATYSWRHFPPIPVKYEVTFLRSVAGKPERVQVRLASASSSGGSLRLKSPYEWLNVPHFAMSFRDERWTIDISFVPQLNGPADIVLEGFAVDRWGMIKNRFDIRPLSLLVIPRARYAAWLARKYLAGTGPGTISTVADVSGVKSLFGLRRGVEYYGSQQYQAGDSLKNIDWKHSVKFNELISKEFVEPHGRPAILLANMTASDDNEADKLAYDIMLTAISLAYEGIPTSLAAYDDKNVLLTTRSLKDTELVVRSMQLVKLINIASNPRRYLNPPDMQRLRSSLNRLRSISSGPASILAEILRVEYENLSLNARFHACSLALAEAKAKTSERCTVVSISGRNHDAEALEYNSYILEKTGEPIIEVKRAS